MTVQQLPRLSRVEKVPLTAPIVWLGTVSFEERCLGSLRALRSLGCHLVGAVVVDYPTHAEPRSVDETRRRAHRNEILDLCQKMSLSRSAVTMQMLHPYRLASVRSAFREVAQIEKEYPGTTLVVDITCLTKAHTLSLALWLATAAHPRRSLSIAYTLPEQYGSPARHHTRSPGWPETVLAPCVLRPDLYSEEASGLVLVGHEGPRLLLALSQLFPEEALVVVWKTKYHEELEIVARTANARLLAEVERGIRPGWSLREASDSDLDEIQLVIETFVQDSVTKHRRIVLFPFGPKPLILAAALTAIEVEPGLTWYCYPIPRAYDVDYSIGTGETEWFTRLVHSIPNDRRPTTRESEQ